MKNAVSLFGASVAAALVLTTLVPIRGADAAPMPEDALFVPGEVVVVFRDRGRPTRTLDQARSLARSVGGRVARVANRSRSAVIKGAPGADAKSLSRRLSANANVRFVEPNYIYRATGSAATAAPPAYVVRRTAGTARKMVVPKDALRAMKTRTRAGIKATYPTDTLLWDNGGWDWVNASIVWNNTTPSKNVCVIDTGVDYLHKDLTTARIIKGWDCVNEDADPMDDNGHGTHVAGIIAAKQNNAEGVAGVSPTAKVVAVKALNADGWGTSWDIAQAIRYCAGRTDVSIVNLSFGGPYSKLQQVAVDQATVVKGKLVVASAGNENSDMPYCSAETTSADDLKAGVRSYPAGFATASKKYDWNGVDGCTETVDGLHPAYTAVLSVAGGGSGSDFDYSCRAGDSNFGDWVNITAPGTNILSTTPWDKPFTMHVEEEVPVRYAYLSGTSTAAAFVSGAAARIWGFMPTETNTYLANYMQSDENGFVIEADGICWPANMAGVTDVNIARAVKYGGLTADAIDAVTGLPLVGATIQGLQGTPLTVKSSAVVAAVTLTSPDYPAGYLYFPSSVDLINLPCTTTTLRVNKAGYTNSATNAFVGGGEPNGTIEAPEGGFLYAGYAAVPPKSPRFTAVSAWDVWGQNPLLTTALPDRDDKPSGTALYDGQMFDFVVGYDVCNGPTVNPYPDLENDPAGELSVFPNAQAVYQGWVDTHQILQRASASALPQWTGDYVFRVYNPDLDFAERQGSLFIWKDGVLKARVDMSDPACDSTTDWWEAATLTSGKSGSATITPLNLCKAAGAIDFPVTCP